VRTWTYALARHEIGRFRQGARKRAHERVPISELENVLAAVKTETRSALKSDKRRNLAKLRDELSEEERVLLVLRVDRSLPWDEIALAFAADPESFTAEDQKRESARLRRRFHLLKRRLVDRARGLRDTSD
jgi:DNA-directed RNA polymerase specialized sigma24 family protein